MDINAAVDLFLFSLITPFFDEMQQLLFATVRARSMNVT